MDEDTFWKQTKKATEGWGAPSSPSSSPLITPVFAHASQEAVRIRKNPLFWFDDPDNLNEYHYLVTLIKKSRKGHYVFFILDASEVAIHELGSQIKLTQDIIRHLFIKIKEKDFDKKPTKMLEENEGEGKQ